MTFPKISIITVVYNAAEDLEKTISSIRSLDYPNIEYIIIDGGSRDETVSVIKKNEDIITKWISEPDKGIYDAMNKGVALSTGEWLSFMNAGDLYYSDSVLRAMFSEEIHANAKLVYGDVELVFSDDNRVLRSQANYSEDNLPFSLCHQSAFVNGDYMRCRGFETSYRIDADANLFYQIKVDGYQYQYFQEIVCIYDATGFSSVNIMASFKEYARIRQLKKTSSKYLKGWSKAFVRSTLNKISPDLYRKIYSLYMELLI